MKKPPPNLWEWLEGLGMLGGLVLVAAGQILDRDVLAWAALLALSVGYAGRLVVLRRKAREDPLAARGVNREAAQGCAIFGVMVVVALVVVVGLIGLVAALITGTPALAGFWTGARVVLVLAVGVTLLLAVEWLVARWPRRR